MREEFDKVLIGWSEEQSFNKKTRSRTLVTRTKENRGTLISKLSMVEIETESKVEVRRDG